MTLSLRLSLGEPIMRRSWRREAKRASGDRAPARRATTANMSSASEPLTHTTSQLGAPHVVASCASQSRRRPFDTSSLPLLHRVGLVRGTEEQEAVGRMGARGGHRAHGAPLRSQPPLGRQGLRTRDVGQGRSVAGTNSPNRSGTATGQGPKEQRLRRVRAHERRPRPRPALQATLSDRVWGASVGLPKGINQ